ncbi:polysaccharide export protein [Rhodomicrobium vannielii ATCC 17100]|uniref:polysaccharide biosynthesis/export family protein n=1 Tax=Rhodomicrobium vannielii TaxID=1069 RepID=UPI001919E9BA|nr:polysaccharide biosynthesis/export family protein [Rhodomicrobium vannielii]MBJ7532842.1 polysaccharide export protein [Rhodomicrobium vannielii ATCC 17100]
MSALIRLLLPAIAAAFISACGVSSGGDMTDPKLDSGAVSDSSPAQNSAASSSKEDSAQAPDDKETLRKVALSMSSVSDPASKTYKIGPLDVVDITVFNVPELSKTVQVSEAGTINFPLIGEFQAGGKTGREVERELSLKLGDKYLQNPQITVFIKNYNSQRVTLEGAVKKPGVYPITGGLSLLQAVAQAQGFEDKADETVLIFRQVNGERQVAKYDVSRIRDGRAEDPALEAGDVIVAPSSSVKEGIGAVFKALPLFTLVSLL